MSRGLRNNNPGNIRHDKDRWRGEVRPSQDRAFKQFETPAWGYRAMFHLIHNYARLHECDTLRKIISRWAPPEDNNHTEAYTASVARDSGVSPDTVLTTTNRDVMVPVVAAMSKVENGRPAVMADVEAGWEMFMKYKR